MASGRLILCCILGLNQTSKLSGDDGDDDDDDDVDDDDDNIDDGDTCDEWKYNISSLYDSP